MSISEWTTIDEVYRFASVAAVAYIGIGISIHLHSIWPNVTFYDWFIISAMGITGLVFAYLSFVATLKYITTRLINEEP